MTTLPNAKADSASPAAIKPAPTSAPEKHDTKKVVVGPAQVEAHKT